MAALSAVRDWGRRVALPAYLVAVIVGGAGCVVWLALGHPILPERQHWPLLGLLAVFLVLGEMYPLTISRAPVDQVYTFSGTPALALVCLGPLWLAVAAQLVALLLQSLKAGSPLLKLGFNLAQYTITIVATRLAYCLVTGKPVLGGHQVFTSSNVAAALLAACVFLVVNVLLVSTVISLSEGESLRRGLVGYVRAELPLSITLLAVAPLVLASLEFNLLTFPLCLLPVLAVRRSAASAAERELAAMHDSLTGLPNRGVLLLEGERLMRRSDVKAGVGLLLVDLDHFKEINDTLGHHAGDQLLRLVSSRLRGAVRPEDVLARLGGDEFAVLCPGVATPEAALSLGQRVIEALGQPFEVAEVTLHVEASVGVALAPLHAEDVESLLQRADVALYQAKSLGRGVAHVYDAANDHYSVERLALMESLRRTLDTNLRVHYQPKVRPDGSIAGVEALVRWEHPEQGLLLPGEFLPAAENSGLLIPLTLHVLDEALRQVAEWRRQGWEWTVAVNISARHLSHLELPAQIASALSRAGLPGSVLTLEVTETSIMSDPTRAKNLLACLRQLGVGISIDDFGTGYSSLAYLRDLSPTEVKIDRTFVAALRSSSRDVAVVRAAVELGHNLDLDVVAEGVEDEETFRMLAALGCDAMQGYYVARPAPADELVAWAESRGTGMGSRTSDVGRLGPTGHGPAADGAATGGIGARGLLRALP